MCTVTIFYKGNNDFILTSNRDEAPNRMAIAPKFYTVDGIKMLFPKDPISDGTWIGVSQRKRMICLLNGGYSKHKKINKYRLSRGVIVKDLLFSKSIENAIEISDFNEIEPFTLVIADWTSKLRFLELVWDGKQKYFSQLLLGTHIWSSSTLYTEQMKQQRRVWFNDYVYQQKLDSEKLLLFHKTGGQYNLDYGIIMDRGHVKTTSITQIEKTKHTLKMSYEEINNSNQVEPQLFNFLEAVNE